MFAGTGCLCTTTILATLLLNLVCLISADIKFSPITFTNEADGWFDVEWSGIPLPSPSDTTDIVVLYATNEVPVEIGTVAPVSYIYPFMINETSWAMGEGSYRFYLPNYFTDIQAVYVRGGGVVPPSAGLLPVSDPPKLGTWLDQGTLMATPEKVDPVRVVLSFTADPSAVRVTWSALEAKDPAVYFGTSLRNLKGTTAMISSYNASDMCTPPSTTLGYFSQGFQLSGQMTGLLPDTRYYYRVGDVSYGFSKIYSFVSPPSSQTDSVLKMFVIADHGAYNPDDSFYFVGGYAQDMAAALSLPKPGIERAIHQSLVSSGGLLFQNGGKVVAEEIQRRINSRRQHGIIINGDLSYSFGYTNRWAMWLDNWKHAFSSMPVLTSAGNHEADDPQLPFDAFDGLSTDSQGECAIPYYNLMRPPQKNPTKYWYSANIGPAHFVQLSTEQIMAPGSEQYQFLEQDLMGVDRTVTPWVIVGWHRPMYMNQPGFSNLTGDSIVSQKLIDQVEPLFAEFGVDVVFSGHIHRYTRSCPVLKGTCVGYNDDGSARGPVHLMTANGGAPGIYYSYMPQPEWLDKEVLDFGFGELEVSMTNLTFSMITSPSPGKMETSDRITLVKPEGWVQDRNQAKILYDSISPTPLPEINKSLFNPLPVILESGSKLTLLVITNAARASACFGPETDVFAFANSPRASEMRPEEVWTYQATLIAFLNATYAAPIPTTQESRSTQYTLNYLLESLLGNNRVGTLPPGCVK